jgi:hypothetical protein
MLGQGSEGRKMAKKTGFIVEQQVQQGLPLS